MACPCRPYLSKLFMPELGRPVTAGTTHVHKEGSPYANGTDADAAGTGDGLRLALEVAAMSIVFIAFVAKILRFARNGSRVRNHLHFFELQVKLKHE